MRFGGKRDSFEWKIGVCILEGRLSYRVKRVKKKYKRKEGHLGVTNSISKILRDFIDQVLLEI